MSDQRLAPALTLKAIGSGREVRLNGTGVPLVLVFVAQSTTELVPPFRTALRSRYPNPATLVIASVIDLHGVPRLMRKMAESALGNRYKAVAAELPAGQDARDYIVMLADWKGEAAAALGIRELGDALTVAVIDAKGALVGTYRGEAPLEGTVALLDSTQG